VLEALPNALGATVWGGSLRADPAARALYAQGIIPILSRFVLEGTAGPFSANAPIQAEGGYRLARAPDGRFMLDMWADLHGPIGSTYGTVDRAGERALAGRVYAEHVLTRPFAPPGERRVTRLDFPGAPDIAATRPATPDFDSIASLPEGAVPLEPSRSADPMPFTFGVVHTDSNMHVNSLVYLRLFEEVALRRFASLGKNAAVLARAMDIAYRRPCFAGQTVRALAQAFEHEGRLGIAAVLVSEGDGQSSAAKPHAYVCMTFGPG
jgi:acyl-CoA thioesterase FadM